MLAVPGLRAPDAGRGAGGTRRARAHGRGVAERRLGGARVPARRPRRTSSRSSPRWPTCSSSAPAATVRCKSVLLGGVSGKVVRTAACPVLILPHGADASLDGLFASGLRETTDTDERRAPDCATARPAYRCLRDQRIPETVDDPRRARRSRQDHDRHRRRPHRRPSGAPAPDRRRPRDAGRRRGRHRRRRRAPDARAPADGARARPQHARRVRAGGDPAPARVRAGHRRSSCSRCRTTPASPARRCRPARSASCSRRPPTRSCWRRSASPPPARTTSTRASAPGSPTQPAGPSGPPDDLSDREVEVLRLIALGHTNTEIARAALPLHAHGRDAPRAHPAEDPPHLARRARPLRARAPPRRDLITSGAALHSPHRTSRRSSSSAPTAFSTAPASTRPTNASGSIPSRTAEP